MNRRVTSGKTDLQSVHVSEGVEVCHVVHPVSSGWVRRHAVVLDVQLLIESVAKRHIHCVTQ